MVAIVAIVAVVVVFVVVVEESRVGGLLLRVIVDELWEKIILSVPKQRGAHRLHWPKRRTHGIVRLDHPAGDVCGCCVRHGLAVIKR